MGGKGSGGERAGAGRKPKDQSLRSLDGNAGHRGRVLTHPSAPPVAPGQTADDVIVDEEHAPNDLNVDERLVWLRLAPFAKAMGTLTKTTELMFLRLCRHIVLESEYAKSVQERGGSNHRGMIQRVDAELGDFGLRAFGKPIAPAVAAPLADPVKERFFGGR